MDKKIESVTVTKELDIILRFDDGTQREYQLLFWLEMARKTGTFILPPD